MAWFGKVKWLVLGQAGLCGMAVYSLLDMAWYYLTVLSMARLEGLVRSSDIRGSGGHSTLNSGEIVQSNIITSNHWHK